MGESRDFFEGGRWSVLAAKVAGLALRGPKGELRVFLEAVVWILRTGAPWRDLCARFGRWDRIYRRYRRWAVAGRWELLRRSLATASSKELVLIDSTIVKAHPHAAGASRKSGGQEVEALGRSNDITQTTAMLVGISGWHG